MTKKKVIKSIVVGYSVSFIEFGSKFQLGLYLIVCGFHVFS